MTVRSKREFSPPPTHPHPHTNTKKPVLGIAMVWAAILVPQGLQRFQSGASSAPWRSRNASGRGPTSDPGAVKRAEEGGGGDIKYDIADTAS